MDKKYFTQIIDKYHLNGLIESVTWNSTKSDGVTVNFVNPTKDCAGSVSTTYDLGLGENNISVYSTSQLYKILNITDNYITVDIVENKNIPTQLNIKDNNFDLNFHLSSEDLIPTVPTINDPEKYECVFSIDEEFVRNFIKAHNALDKPNVFTIECKVEDEEQYVEFCVGESASYANKIKFRQSAKFLIGFEKITFNASIFKEIITVNKLASNTIEIIEQGLMKMTFIEDTITSKYFMVKLSE